ncbi:hypothetical protein [uncultured Mycolicibacterium sp.]|uniref:hypothetical protein n=1 Tax=uncultured Mycolicibacterium sp. TaxID=2320817 RepID=UPI002612A36B|nr:hypothetical protein [uncultured Mycolicibacterium sp.]
MKRLAAVVVSLTVGLAGCGSRDAADSWTDREVSFEADGLTIHGSYRYDDAAGRVPAALLISESGNTDRNGDNAVAGAIGNMRQLAELLAERGVASLRYDKVGTGRTGLGPYADNPAQVGSAVYTAGAGAAVRFLAEQPGTDPDRISVYGLGEGAVHALALAGDTTAGAPRIHALGLLQPLPGRYLDIITARVRADRDAALAAGTDPAEANQVLDAWLAAVEQVRSTGTAPNQLPAGLSAILNPGNVQAVAEADAVDPLALAARVPAGTPVLLTCSDADGQADCAAERPLIDALGHTDLTVVELKGVNHVLRDDPTDNVGNYASQDPLSPQLVKALDGFVHR